MVDARAERLKKGISTWMVREEQIYCKHATVQRIPAFSSILGEGGREVGSLLCDREWVPR